MTSGRGTRGAAKAAIVLAGVVLLLSDVLLGRFSIFRQVCDQDDLNRKLVGIVLRTEPGEVALIPTLLRRGADIEYRDARDEPPLYTAVNAPRHEEQVAVIRLLIAEGADVNARKRQFGDTALHWAALRGYADICALLLSHGAEVDARNCEGSTALHYAAGERVVSEIWTSGFVPMGDEPDQIAVAEFLVAQGADPGARNHAGRTPVDSAGQWGRVQLKERLQACRRRPASGVE